MFKIQISNPAILSLELDEDISLEDSIEYIFPLDTDFLIIIWNSIFIPLTYKYDISLMVLDFIKIIQFIENDKDVKMEVHWASNTFACVWKLEKVKEQIIIKSKWDNVIGGTVDLLNKSSENIINEKEFRREINKLLIFLMRALNESGISSNRIDGYKLLEQNCR